MTPDGADAAAVGAVTVVACGEPGCPHAAAGPAGLDDALRAAVRSTPHAVLVRSGCLRGGCDPSGGGAGPHLLAQPCDALRRPRGAAVVLGPLHEPADVAEACGWIRGGATTPAPRHLVEGVVVAVHPPH